MARSNKDDLKKREEAEKTERDEVMKWLTRIENSERFRKKAGDKYRWLRLTEEYKGYFQGLTDATDIYIPSLNYMFAYIKSEIPSLSMRDPKIKVNPKNGTSVLAAKILEKALNYIWRKKKIKRENKKNIFDNLLQGHSWFKVGYVGNFGSVEDAEGNTFEFIEDEEFFGYRIPVENIAFNPDAQDPPYDCRWIAHEVWMPLEEAKNNKDFKHTDMLTASRPNPESEDTDASRQADDANRGDPDVSKCKLFEVWDKKKQAVFIVSPGVPFYIREPRKWPYKLKGFPFSFLRLNDDPDQPYGIPDCYMFEQQVTELMKIRATQLDHLKRFNRQLLVAEGHMTDDAMALFTQAITGATIPVRTDGKPLNDMVQPVIYPPLPSDMYAVEDRIQGDIRKISGQSDLDQGAPQKTQTRTIGELQEIQQGGSKRRSDKLDTIEDFIEDIANNYTTLLQQLADVPQFVRMSGEDPQTVIDGLGDRPSAKESGAEITKNGFTFTKDDIQGEFDFEVVAGSTAPLDQNQQWQVVMNFIELAPKAGAIPGGPFVRALAAKAAELTDMPELIIAMKQEMEEAQKMAEANAAAQKTMQDQQIAQASAELEIKAQREGTRQMDTEIKGLKAAHDVMTDRQEPKKEPKKNGM